MDNSLPYFDFDFDFQKKIIADASECGIDLNWMVRRGICFKQIIDGKTEFVLKNRVSNNILQNVIRKRQRVIKCKMRREIYDEIQKESINRDEAIDFSIKKKIGFNGGFGIYVSVVLRKMCWVGYSEAKERVKDGFTSNGPWIPEILDDEVRNLYNHIIR